MKLRLEGGRLLCPASGLDQRADLLIEDGVIAAIGGKHDADRVLDCRGQTVVPAFVDLDTVLGDPGQAWREDLETGSAAALRGGYTTLLASPATDPVLDDPVPLRELVERARAEAGVEVLVAGALTHGLAGKELAELGLLQEAGASAFSQAGRHAASAMALRNALLYARPFGLPVLLRAGEASLETVGVMHEGHVSTLAGLRGLPVAAEEMGLARLLALARDTGARLHVTGISSARAVTLLRSARAEGLAISASTPAHQLLLTDTAVLDSDYDSALRLVPPLRSEEDRQALLQGVREGVIDTVVSAHCPWTRVEKELEFALAEPGAVGLETAFAAALTALGELSTVVRALSQGPAALLGLDRSLRVGSPAELAVVDEQSQVVDPHRFASRGRNTPLAGMTLKGRVRATVHRGELAFEDQDSD